MKRLYIYLVLIMLMCFTSSFAQQIKYEVKVVLDSVESVKGTLQKVSPDGIAVTDFRGNYYIFKAKNIVKIKVRRKGLNFVESLTTGTGIGLAAGATLVSVAQPGNDLALGLAAAFTTVGAFGGILGGLAAEALNTKLILTINSDTQKFKKEYPKLEKYSKDYYLGKLATNNN